MLRALGDYGRLMIFPSSLHMERTVFDPRNYGDIQSWRASAQTEYLSIAGFLLIAGMGFACWKHTAGHRLRIFGAFWFLLAYLPISNIVDLNATSAEHWLYLPSIGFLIFLAGCVIDVTPRQRAALVTFACLAVVALGIRSAVRSSDWITAETFYERTIASGGGSARLGVNLALIYAGRGEDGKAEKLLRYLLKTSPDFPVVRNNLANLLQKQGKIAEAEAMFAASNVAAVEVRKEYPHTWIAAVNLARLQHSRNDNDSAIAVLEKARADYPKVWEIISFEATLLQEKEETAAALRLVDDFLRANWWHYQATLARGRLLAQKGDVEASVAAFRFASWLDVNDSEALYAIACLRVRQDRLEEAVSIQRRAVARQPDQPRQYLLLSDILGRLGRQEEAQANLASVRRLQAFAQANPL
jgi:tetratricopeptide (TPR) repeat protein